MRKKSPPSAEAAEGWGNLLLVALGVIAILLILVPGYRWFFLISAGVGIGVAALLRWWYARRPVKVENKRPLGVD